MVPGWRTLLQPTSAPSPRKAPTLRSPVAWRTAVDQYTHGTPVELEICADNTCPQVGAVSEDGIAHVVEVRRLHLIEAAGSSCIHRSSPRHSPRPTITLPRR